MLLDIAGPISLSAFKVCERLILSRTRLQLPTICFASTEEGTFHSVLVKNASYRISAGGATHTLTHLALGTKVVSDPGLLLHPSFSNASRLEE